MDTQHARRNPSDDDLSLLWAAASVAPDLAKIAELARQADLTLILETALQQRVLGLVLRSLDRAGVEDLGPQGDEARTDARILEARGRLAIPGAAISAIDAMNAADVRPMAIKGLAIVDLYESPGLRPMDDIDILVPRDLVDRAKAALEDAGWRWVPHPEHRYDYGLVRPSAPGVNVELHYDLSRWAERMPGLVERLWDERVPIEVFGRTVWGLPPHAQIVTTIVHAAKEFHAFNRLIWPADVALITRHHAVDWERVHELAELAGRRGALAIGLNLARRLGADVPDEALALPRQFRGSRSVAQILDPMLPFEPPYHMRSRGYVLVDGVVRKVRFAVGDLVRPTGPTTRRRDVVRDLISMLPAAAHRVFSLLRPRG
jgi:hypothetical protein